jgi:hypothetical protein
MEKPRTSIEVEPVLLKAIRIIAARESLRVKQVTERLLRYSLVRVDYIFSAKKQQQEKETK